MDNVLFAGQCKLCSTPLDSDDAAQAASAPLACGCAQFHERCLLDFLLMQPQTSYTCPMCLHVVTGDDELKENILAFARQGVVDANKSYAIDDVDFLRTLAGICPRSCIHVAKRGVFLRDEALSQLIVDLDVDTGSRHARYAFKKKKYLHPAALAPVAQDIGITSVVLLRFLRDGEHVEHLPAFADGHFPPTADVYKTFLAKRPDRYMQIPDRVYEKNAALLTQACAISVDAFEALGRRIDLTRKQTLLAAKSLIDKNDFNYKLLRPDLQDDPVLVNALVDSHVHCFKTLPIDKQLMAWQTALKVDGHLIQFVPVQHRTKTMRKTAVATTPEAVKHLQPPVSADVLEKVLQRNPSIIRHINAPSLHALLFALCRDPSTRITPTRIAHLSATEQRLVAIALVIVGRDYRHKVVKSRLSVSDYVHIKSPSTSGAHHSHHGLDTIPSTLVRRAIQLTPTALLCADNDEVVDPAHLDHALSIYTERPVMQLTSTHHYKTKLYTAYLNAHPLKTILVFGWTVGAKRILQTKKHLRDHVVETALGRKKDTGAHDLFASILIHLFPLLTESQKKVAVQTYPSMVVFDDKVRKSHLQDALYSSDVDFHFIATDVRLYLSQRSTAERNALICYNPALFKYLTVKERNDFDVALACILLDPCIIKYCGPAVRADVRLLQLFADSNEKMATLLPYLHSKLQSYVLRTNPKLAQPRKRRTPSSTAQPKNPLLKFKRDAKKENLSTLRLVMSMLKQDVSRADMQAVLKENKRLDPNLKTLTLQNVKSCERVQDVHDFITFFYDEGTRVTLKAVKYILSRCRGCTEVYSYNVALKLMNFSNLYLLVEHLMQLSLL